MKKRVLSLTLCLCLCLSPLPTAAGAAAFSGGSGTEADPYRIATLDQLKDFRDEVNGGNAYAGKYIVLTGDLDLGGEDDPWEPIGINSAPFTGAPFTGTFDGGGHEITGLYINSSTKDNQGLFGYVNLGGTVKNLSVSGNVTGHDDVGGVVGYNEEGTIENCYNTGTVRGNYCVGGVAGENFEGTLTSCYNTGAVTADDKDAGGVLGYNECTFGGSVENCYNTGAVFSGNYSGGVIGFCYSGIVANCYNTGTVSGGGGDVGGVVGKGIPMTNCYYLDTCGAEGDGESKSAEDFKDQSNFDGWDFTAVWAMSDVLGRPILRANPEPEPHTYTFDLDGGTWSVEQLVYPTGEDFRIPGPVPTKEGYGFCGWMQYIGENENGICWPGERLGDVSRDHRLVALWGDRNVSVIKDGQTEYYTCLEDATRLVTGGSTVRVERDYTDDNGGFFTHEDGVVTLDLNGKTVTGGVVVTAGDLVITGDGTMVGNAIIHTYGALTVESGTFGVLAEYGVAPLTLNGGTFTGVDGQKAPYDQGIFIFLEYSEDEEAAMLDAARAILADALPQGKKLDRDAKGKSVEEGGTTFTVLCVPGPVSVIHDHTMQTGAAWTHDGTGHWRQCTDPDCPDLAGSKTDAGEHVYDDQDTTCITCGYTRTPAPSSSRRPSTARPAPEPEQPAPVSQRFVDVPAGAWFEVAVQYVVDNGVFIGASETTFAPDLDTSRAMLATLLWRMAGSPETEAALPYPDCDTDSWYTAAVAWGTEQGVVKGYGDGSFGPNDPITREQLAVMLYRYAKAEGKGDIANGTEILRFADTGDVADWAKEAMTWAVSAGVLQGKSADILDPAGSATRAEVATMLWRFLAV